MYPRVLPNTFSLSDWNDDKVPVRTHHFFENGTKSVFAELEMRGVFFSFPMDLDFSMLLAFPDAYGVQQEVPDDSTIKAVLGKSHHDSSQYSYGELNLFSTYHKLFKLGSKPAAHIDALSQLSDEDLLANMPESFGRLTDAVIAKLAELPE